MVYGALVAGGKGTRIKDNIDLPKQYRCVNGVPVIIRTIKKLLDSNSLDLIYVAVSTEMLDYMNNLLNDYSRMIDTKKIRVMAGGKERIDTIENIVNAIYEDNPVDESDIIFIHDAVRPFVTDKIIKDSINAAKEYKAVVAAIPVSDTLLISNDGNSVDNVPVRKLYYKGQAPDTYNLKLFRELLNNIPKEERSKITGTCQIATLNNYPLHMIEGDEVNFKITTLSDFVIANNITMGDELDEKNDVLSLRRNK